MTLIVVHSKSAAEHVGHFGTLLARLREHNLKLAPSKANVGAAQVEFLGHLITPSGLAPGCGKVAALKNLKMSTNKSELRSMLGSFSHLRKCIPGLSSEIRELNALLKKDV